MKREPDRAIATKERKIGCATVKVSFFQGRYLAYRLSDTWSNRLTCNRTSRCAGTPWSTVQMTSDKHVAQAGLPSISAPRTTTAAQHYASPAVAAQPWVSYRPLRRWGFLVILFLVVTSNYFDYYVISVLLEPIKREFHVSDTMLGILSGSCFSLAYAMTALPIARWADHGNRRTVIIAALATWSLMTTLCGFSRSYLQLALARFGVGMAEPGAIPPAQSLLMDYFH
jgi:hypothetical protein